MQGGGRGCWDKLDFFRNYSNTLGVYFVDSFGHQKVWIGTFGGGLISKYVPNFME